MQKAELYLQEKEVRLKERRMLLEWQAEYPDEIQKEKQKQILPGRSANRREPTLSESTMSILQQKPGYQMSLFFTAKHKVEWGERWRKS